jgi:hypothetical protein
VNIDGVLLASGSGNLMFYGASEVIATGSGPKFLDGGSVMVWHMGNKAV